MGHKSSFFGGSFGSLSTIAISCYVALVLCSYTKAEEGATGHSNETEVERYQLVTFDFPRVGVPYVICLWVLIVSLAKIVFHLNHKLPENIPESCLLISLGLILGALLHFTKVATTSEYTLDADIFFIYLLPPIIFDAGYFMPVRSFFDNLGTVLLLAVVNTCISAGLIGVSLWGAAKWGLFGRDIGILNCFIFGSLISAVDPVAVISVFEEVHVNEMLYIIVFGESLLNDGVTVVLYHMMEGFIEIGESNIIPVDVVTGLGSFFIIALGGTLIGILFGLFGGFITKYTHHVKVIEPLFVFVLGYMMYLTSEMCHLSGILALSFGGITLRHYLESNVSRKTRTSIKYFMKMLANISETIIFMFLGLSTMVDTLDWNLAFIFLSLLFCLIYRILGVAILSWILNKRRLIKLSFIDQFIMAYGGLRGGIAFCLSLSLDEKLVPEKQLFVTATIVIVFFTVFIQGITVKPVVNALKVKRQPQGEANLNEKVNETMIDHLMAGVEGITKKSGHNLMRSKFRHWNHKYIKPLLNREEISKSKADKVLDVFHTISVADALDHLGNDVDVVEIPNGQKLSLVKNSSSVNGFHNVALNIGDENDPSLRQSYQEGVATQRRARFIICRDSTTLEEEYPKTMQFKDKQADQVTSHLATVVIQDSNVDNIQHVKAGGTGGMNSVSSPKGGNSVNADGRTEANGGHVDKENNENLDGVTLSFKSRDQNENDAEDAKEENSTKGSFLARQDMPALSPQTATEMELPWKSSCEPIKVSHDSCDQDISQDNQITDSFLSLAVQDSTQSFALPISIDVSNCDDEDEEEPTPPVTATEMQLPWKQEILEPDKTATELELPWKSTSRQDSISAMSCSTRHSYDDFPMPAHMPTWVDNLSYSHLLESGSPYASPDATIIPKKKETKPSVQDLFGFFQQASNQLMENMNDKAEDQDQVDKKDSETTVTLSNQRSMSEASVLSSHCVSKECLPPSSKSTDNIPDSSGTLPLPWMSQASDFMPVTSHMAREQSDKSCNYLVSNHTLPPPSHHHVIIPTMHLTEASLSNVCSEDSDHKPLKTLPGSASAPDLPKHFHHIEHTFSSRDRLQSESIMEDIRIQEQLQSRVQEWLINSSPADDNGIVIDFYDQEKPELSSDNDADDESFEDDDEDWGDL